MKKKVLITGASGFIGYHLIIEALEVGLEVYAAVRPTSNIKHLMAFDIHYTTLDFTSVGRLKQEIEDKQYHYIIHAAGTTSAKTVADYNKVNAEYSENLARAACLANNSLEKFIFISSLAAVGPLTTLFAQINEDTPPHPVTSYGKSKLLAEEYLMKMDRLPLLIIRPTAVYGPRETDILILFKTINKGLEPYIGRFDQRLSFIYVKDLAKIVILALSSPFINKAYNATDGEIYSRYSLAEAVKRVLNKKTLRIHLPVPVVNVMAIFMEMLYQSRTDTPTLNKEKMNELTAINWSCNISMLKNELAYLPQIKLEEGLKETLDWYKLYHWL